jgi:hypothetical protein
VHMRESSPVGGAKDICKCYAIAVQVHTVIKTKLIQKVVLIVLHPQFLMFAQFSAQSFQLKLRRNMFTGLTQCSEYKVIFFLTQLEQVFVMKRQCVLCEVLFTWT